MLIEIELVLSLIDAGADVQITAFGCANNARVSQRLGAGIDRLDAFSDKVRRALEMKSPLPDDALSEAHALYSALLKGDLLTLVTEASAPPLVRLTCDRALQAVPWEALCRPDTGGAFLGGASELLLARGICSPQAWSPRTIDGAVRVLAVSPTGSAELVGNVKDTLADAVIWLDPVIGSRASTEQLFRRLNMDPTPHVLHIIGHGGDDATLRLADDSDDEPVWIRVDQLAAALADNHDLRLLVLEYCEGAKPAAFGSAAEVLLAVSGADAVIAHLWPVSADVARNCSADFYHALTRGMGTRGDLVRSLAAARRTMLAKSAEGFSPVLYLRAPRSDLFDFSASDIPATR
jgi:CHAT domain